MEEPESEWEIQEYPSSKEGDDDDKTSIVKWILNNGYVIGKNMVITGVVISSAPIVVPPLVALSVVGFVFSVPFGFVFATYACTNKIMSTLLPIPRSPSPLMLEYEQEKHQRAKCRFELDNSGDNYRQINEVEEGYHIDEYSGGGGGGEVEDLVTNVDGDGDEERYYIGEEENEEDELGLENVVEEEDNEQMEDLNRGVNIVIELDEGGDPYGKQGEASIMNVDENVDEESHHANENVDEKEMEDRVVQQENIVIEEEEKEQMEDRKKGVAIVSELNEGSDDYGKQGEASIMNVDDNVDEESNYATENVDEKEIEARLVRREIVVIEEKEKKQMEDIKQGFAIFSELNEGGNDYGKQGEASIMNVDENVDEEIMYANENVDEKEMEDHLVQRENVVIEEEEKEKMENIKPGVAVVSELDEGGFDYGKQGEASIMNVDENVDEEIIYTNVNIDEKEMEELLVRREIVVIEEEEKEQMEDIKQGVAIVSELDEGSDDYEKQWEASIMNLDDNIDEESNYATENVDEKEMKDHVVQSENVVIEEEEKEQMEDIRQGVAFVSELDKGGFDYERQGEASIMNVDENVDEESYYAYENLDEKEMEDHVFQRENVVIEEEEKEQMEDIKQGVEMRLGLDVVGEDQGYEEDVGEYLEGDDDSFEDERKEEPLIEGRIDENKSTREVTEDVMEEKVKGSTRLWENVRNESNANATVEDDYLLDESALVFEDPRDVEKTEPVLVKEIEDPRDVERTEPVMVKEIESEKLKKDGRENEETIGEIRHVVILAEGNEDNNFNLREVAELDLVAREVKGDTNKNARKTESEEKVMRESMGTQEETCGYTSNEESEDSILQRKKERLIHSYADAREIGDGSGLDIFDERNTNIHFTTLEGADEEKEDIADENVDFVALPAFKRTPLAMDNGKAPSKTETNTKIPTREDILDEERIWEKIGAMRTIVGYKAPIQAACIGELKALYVFTGVEPPASFKDDSNLNEVNAKLKFLMSIVGVK